MGIPSRVAIMGCGPGGSYLYSLLRQKKPDIEVAIFDLPHHNACGLRGCAWGVSWLKFSRLCREAGAHPEKYVLGRHAYILVNDLKVNAEVAMVDKPSFIKDMLGGQSPQNPSGAELDRFDRIIDATGLARAYLSPRGDGPIVDTVQVRLELSALACPRVLLSDSGGYTWVFPLRGDEAHLGSVSPLGIEVARQEMERVRRSLDAGRTLCCCAGRLRCHGPLQPFIEGKIWGLGEAIGLVEPVTGAGIIPAMTSAKFLVVNWDDAQGYERQVWREYSYMVKAVRIAAKLMARERLRYRDMLMPRRAFQTVGVNPSLGQIIRGVARVRRLGGAKHRAGDED